jgi:inhibitor of KinA
MNKPKIIQFGANGISLSWDEKIDPDQHSFILAFTAMIEEKFKSLIVETVTTYHSTLLFVRSSSVIQQLMNEIEGISIPEFKSTDVSSTKWLIPVCYDSRFGLDLAYIASETSLSISEIIQIHTSTPYRIYFSGFLPGFLYLGGLDARMHLARKSTPRLNVPKGAVGIGGSQTGIYPKKCPGGWQLLGQTPISMFDISSNELSPFKPGDTIRFESIDYVDYLRIEEEIILGNYQLKKIPND